MYYKYIFIICLIAIILSNIIIFIIKYNMLQDKVEILQKENIILEQEKNAAHFIIDQQNKEILNLKISDNQIAEYHQYTQNLEEQNKKFLEEVKTLQDCESKLNNILKHQHRLLND